MNWQWNRDIPTQCGLDSRLRGNDKEETAEKILLSGAPHATMPLAALLPFAKGREDAVQQHH